MYSSLSLNLNGNEVKTKCTANNAKYSNTVVPLCREPPVNAPAELKARSQLNRWSHCFTVQNSGNWGGS